MRRIPGAEKVNYHLTSPIHLHKLVQLLTYGLNDQLESEVDNYTNVIWIYTCGTSDSANTLYGLSIYII